MPPVRMPISFALCILEVEQIELQAHTVLVLISAGGLVKCGEHRVFDTLQLYFQHAILPFTCIKAAIISQA